MPGRMTDIGSSAYQYRTNGWGEQANEFLREWQGAAEKAKRVNEMLRNSPIVAALRLAIELPILDIEWQWTSDDGENDPRLELMREAWEGVRWREHLMDALLFPFYGWSLFTLTYKADGGRILWKRLKPLRHETIQRWILEGDDELTGVQQWPHLWPDEIPLDRMLLYRYRSTNPEGESILRPSYRSWVYVRELEQIEAIGLERHMAGFPVITAPETTDMTESDDPDTPFGRATQIVRNIRRDEQGGLVKPFGWVFELMSTGSSGAAETDMVINRHNKQILMSALAQFIALGMENVGALATFEGANDFFTLAINALADVVAESFTEQAAARLLALNGLEPKGIKLSHAPAGRVEPAKVASALQSLGEMITWTPEDESWLRDVMRLPHKDADELEALQEEAKEERAAEMEQAMMQKQAAQGDEAEPEDEDDMHATELYGADADAMARWERQYTRKMIPFLAAQQRRALRYAKAAKNG
jgi:hypothetical protein